MKQECLIGGTNVVTIQFQNKEELDFFYKLIQENAVDFLRVETKLLELTMKFQDSYQEQSFIFIHNLLKRFILDKKRMDWCQQILEKDFFYTDEDERIQIIDMIYSIIEGKRKDIPIEIDHTSLEKQIDQALMEVLRSSKTFSIDAFITFRLRFYIEKLSSYIELAIDEYKLEQEYQSFIFYLRNFLADRKAQMTCIYVVNDEGFQFFDENKRLMKRSELNKRIDRKLLSDHPVYVDSVTIAPLISIAPEVIYLYTNHSENGIIQTLKNIFEEKLNILPLDAFNFIN